MSTTKSVAAQADELSRRRAHVLPFLAIIYFSQQMSFLTGDGGHRDVDHFKIGAWVVLSVVMLLALVTNGFWFRPKAVREMLDDEVTRAHRDDATRWGFLFGMLAAIACYFIAEFWAWSAADSAHLVLTFGIGAALVRLAWLERRAHGG